MWLWELDFKMRLRLTIRGLNSQRRRRELNYQRGLDSRGLPCFSTNVLFLLQHCYSLFISLCIFYLCYSRILVTKRSWSYLAIQPSNVVLVGRPIVNAALMSTFLTFQDLSGNNIGFCWIVYLILFFSYNSIPPCLV